MCLGGTHHESEFFDPWFNSNLKPNVKITTDIIDFSDVTAIKLEYFHANARVVPENGVNFTAEVDAARTWLQANHIFIEDEIWTTCPGT